jgi:riboflavin synthase
LAWPPDSGEDGPVFTGIVEELGRFVERRGERFRFAATTVLGDARTGDSIATNGCCLTVVDQGGSWWEADVSEETLRRTNLGALSPGDPINLERPLRLSDRLGGHLVQGHVDGVGTVLDSVPDLRVSIPADLLRYCVAKGSITVDGVSLTIVEVGRPAVPGGEGWCSFAIIPHTAAVTTLGHKGPGAAVNLEVDVMAKHVESLMLAYLPAADRPAPDRLE